MRIRPLFLLLLCCLIPGLANAAPKNSTALQVQIDKGETISLPGLASSVSIANPEIADVQVLSPSTLMVVGKQLGETNLLAVDASNNVLLQRRVQVRLNTDAVAEALSEIDPTNNVRVQAVPGGLMLTGEVPDVAMGADMERVAARFVPANGQLINRLKIGASSQIMLKVKVAEVNRDVSRSFGINWQNAFRSMGFAIGLSQGAVLNNLGAFGLNTARPNSNNNTINFDYRRGDGDIDINGFIDALAQDGLITVLAEPNLTALSGQTASFLAGGEYPILIPQGNGTISIEYRDYGVKLSFTPTLLGANRINLKVRPEVSELSTEGQVVLQNVSVPSLRVRRAETTVEVGSGQSFAIAGLLSDNQNQAVRKFPFLGDAPVLGPLFRSTSFQNKQSELVIIVTPYIVQPNTTTASAPTDGLVPPTEFERVFGLRQTSATAGRPISGADTAVAVPAAAPSTPDENLWGDSATPSFAREPNTSAAPRLPVSSATPLSAPVAAPAATPAAATPPPTNAASQAGFVLE